MNLRCIVFNTTIFETRWYCYIKLRFMRIFPTICNCYIDNQRLIGCTKSKFLFVSKIRFLKGFQCSLVMGLSSLGRSESFTNGKKYLSNKKSSFSPLPALPCPHPSPLRHLQVLYGHASNCIGTTVSIASNSYESAEP